MIINRYAIYDKKSGIYDIPFYAKDDLQAIRHFHILSRREGSNLRHFTADFDLTHIGSYNTETGKDEFIGKIETILTGKELDDEI
jgi:hypothetical protein